MTGNLLGSNPFLILDLTHNLNQLPYVAIFLLLYTFKDNNYALTCIMIACWILASVVATTSFYFHWLGISIGLDLMVVFIVSGFIALVLMIMSIKPLMIVLAVILMVIGYTLPPVSNNFVSSMTKDQPASVPYPTYFQEHKTQGTIAMNDSLTESSDSSWEVSKGGTCRFSDQVYKVKTPAKFNVCHGPMTVFQDLTYEVEMTILQGDCGGLLFGENTTHSAYYIFRVCQDRSYNLLLYTDGGGPQPIILKYGTSKEIIPKVGATNRIAVLTQGTSIYFYVNGRQIAEAHDTHYFKGYVALISYSLHGKMTEVAYENVKVWVDQAK